MKINKTFTVVSLLIVTTLFSFKNADDIKGWFLAGSAPKKYEIGVTTDSARKGKIGYLKSTDKKIDNQFGTIMQNFIPEEYLGKRVKLTAFIKAENIDDWAGMWMRVDGSGGKTLSFDNMQDRAIKGSKDWKEYEIILDVPKGAINLAYGVLLSGTGKVFIDDFKFSIVKSTVKSTNTTPTKTTKPTNTSFDN